MKTKNTKVLHLPFKVVDGMIEMEYGGAMPLKEGAQGELLVSADWITEKEVIQRYTEPQFIRLLPEGTELLVMLSNNRPFYLPSELEEVAINHSKIADKLGKWFSRRRFASVPSFVSIRIGPLLPWQDAPDKKGSGGLWLELEGPRVVAMKSSSIILPDVVKTDRIISLNHAFTVLSEHFEPQRISHTGNVYEQVLYQESDGLWYPLKLFRDGATAEKQQEMARACWEDLKARLAAWNADG